MLILSEAVNLRWDFLRKRKRKRNSLEFLSPTGTQEFLGKGRGQMLEKFLQEPRNALINSFKVPLHDSELIHFPQNFEYVTLTHSTQRLACRIGSMVAKIQLQLPSSSSASSL